MKKVLIKKQKQPAPALPAFSAHQLTIDNFRIVRGSLDAGADFDSKMVEQYEVNYDFDMGFNIAGSLVRSVLRVDVKTKSRAGQSPEAKGQFELHYYFNVDGLRELAKADKDGIVKINPDLANAIASVTYSTTRGILMARMQNTAFEDFILPVVSPNELVNKGARK
ncbi:MAG TPA: hypothetical protein VK826_01390 [Bacteroidia bacterium]|nr:hypothetical protein [Bacteroidia bacterium]